MATLVSVGPDWSDSLYGDSDGGFGQRGRVEQVLDGSSKVRVLWKCKARSTYRWGSAYDLKVVYSKKSGIGAVAPASAQISYVKDVGLKTGSNLPEGSDTKAAVIASDTDTTVSDTETTPTPTAASGAAGIVPVTAAAAIDASNAAASLSKKDDISIEAYENALTANASVHFTSNTTLEDSSSSGGNDVAAPEGESYVSTDEHNSSDMPIPVADITQSKRFFPANEAESEPVSAPAPTSTAPYMQWSPTVDGAPVSIDELSADYASVIEVFLLDPRVPDGTTSDDARQVGSWWCQCWSTSNEVRETMCGVRQA